MAYKERPVYYSYTTVNDPIELLYYSEGRFNVIEREGFDIDPILGVQDNVLAKLHDYFDKVHSVMVDSNKVEFYVNGYLDVKNILTFVSEFTTAIVPLSGDVTWRDDWPTIGTTINVSCLPSYLQSVCQSFEVCFDATLWKPKGPTFSDIYEVSRDSHGTFEWKWHRPIYYQRKKNGSGEGSQTGKFSYCESEEAWWQLQFKLVASIAKNGGVFAGVSSGNRGVPVDVNGIDFKNAIQSYLNSGKSTYGTKISCWDVSEVTDMSSAFAYLSTFNELLCWDVSSVTTMENMFKDAIAFNQPMSSWNVSRVANMHQLFKDAIVFNGDISSWDVSSVTTMDHMFQDANIFNRDISSWDISSVTDMNNMRGLSTKIFLYGMSQASQTWVKCSTEPLRSTKISLHGMSRGSQTQNMFYRASAFNQDTSSWNFKFQYGNGIRTDCDLFHTCTWSSGNQGIPVDVNGIDFRNAIKSYLRIGKSPYGTKIGCWDISNVTDMHNAFKARQSFNESILCWDVSSVTNMKEMFHNARAFNQDISLWNVSSVTAMAHMFRHAQAFNHDISSWDVSSVTNMYWMFRQAFAFNEDISSWDVSSVTMMGGVFYSANVFNQDVSSWNVSRVENMKHMFYSAKAFNQDVSSWDVSSLTKMGNMFYNAKVFNQDISSWNVSSVTGMESLFSYAEAFNHDISSWDVSSVTNMKDMFHSAKVFNHDISSWDVSSVTNMENMFVSASGFNQDISSWDVSSVTAMGSMFNEASAFNQDLCDWAVKTPFLSDVSFLGDSMFEYTACPNHSSPQLVSQGGTTTNHWGPFCHTCTP
eukprot:scaffold90524_cov30-Attheya_sp.AAC.1